MIESNFTTQKNIATFSNETNPSLGLQFMFQTSIKDKIKKEILGDEELEQN